MLDKTRMDAPTRRLLLREISILEMLHHPNIVRLYEVRTFSEVLHRNWRESFVQNIRTVFILVTFLTLHVLIHRESQTRLLGRHQCTITGVVLNHD